MPKLKTLSEAETARRRAITGLRNLGRDEDADRIEGLSTREYADGKGFEIIENPYRRRFMATRKAPTRAELEDRVAELEEQLEDVEQERDELQEQIDQVADLVAPPEEEEEDGETGDDRD